MQLNHGVSGVGIGGGHRESDRGMTPGDLGIPCSADISNVATKRGRTYKADTALWNGHPDLGMMDLKWVLGTKDPLFSGLSRYERHVLFLFYVQERPLVGESLPARRFLV